RGAPSAGHAGTTGGLRGELSACGHTSLARVGRYRPRVWSRPEWGRTMTDGTDSWGRVFLCAASGGAVAYTTIERMRMQGKIFSGMLRLQRLGFAIHLLKSLLDVVHFIVLEERFAALRTHPCGYRLPGDMVT